MTYAEIKTRLRQLTEEAWAEANHAPSVSRELCLYELLRNAQEQLGEMETRLAATPAEFLTGGA